MNAFIAAAAALTFAALVLLLSPWWRAIGKDGRNRRATSADFPAALNAAIHRDRLGELERDQANGVISAGDYAEACEELQRQLLDDTSAAEPVIVAPARRWRGLAPLVLIVLLPAAAIGLYALLGNPDALLSNAERSEQAVATMNGLIARLEQKMAQNPANAEGWAMLARAYKAMGRWDDAERAFARVGPPLEQNAALLADLADVLVEKTGRFAGRPHELIEQALRLEPDNGKALLLAGAEAFTGHRYAAAAAHWERVLQQVEPGSDDARMIASGIAKARAMGGENGGAKGGATSDEKVGAGLSERGLKNPFLDDTAQSSKTTRAAAMAGAVSGRVELSPALRAQTTPGETVFILARAVHGSRMPLAVRRARVADLPLDFMLDDSQAMSPDNKISSAQELRIEVRVSKSGQAMPGRGDLTGSSAAVKPGTKGIRVVINQVVE